ncbi:hypothetical protein [Paenibacillus agilis]|uniref:Uncharacterized protein n=1 Tax=Paenibacillus agilis TaxID=3020863 RepID=A0A559IXF0_9BACL|nr:hypothetical protein [Paenibacillus agilis]TVX92271.1 hypothetical protein FPZ44_03850 [Paenibacillus agilis]
MNQQDKPNGKMTKVEMEMAVDQMLEFLPVFIAQAQPQAQLLRSKYVALKAEGFSDKEALHIVSTRPLYE